MKAFKDYYKILEISINATQDDIKIAYRKMAMKYHPDRNSGFQKESEQKMKELNEANEVLKNENSREFYDIKYREHYLWKNSNKNKYSSQTQNRNTDNKKARYKNESTSKTNSIYHKVVYVNLALDDFLLGTKIKITEPNFYLKIPPKTKPWTIFKVNWEDKYIYHIVTRMDKKLFENIYSYELNEIYYFYKECPYEDLYYFKNIDLTKIYRCYENIVLNKKITLIYEPILWDIFWNALFVIFAIIWWYWTFFTTDNSSDSEWRNVGVFWFIFFSIGAISSLYWLSEKIRKNNESKSYYDSRISELEKTKEYWYSWKEKMHQI